GGGGGGAGEGGARGRGGGAAGGKVGRGGAPPARPGGVRGGGPPADELAADRGDAHGHPVGGEGPCPPRAGVEGAEDRQHLRGHHRGRTPLGHTRHVQEPGGGRQPAGGAGQREQRAAQGQHGAPPVHDP